MAPPDSGGAFCHSSGKFSRIRQAHCPAAQQVPGQGIRPPSRAAVPFPFVLRKDERSNNRQGSSSPFQQTSLSESKSFFQTKSLCQNRTFRHGRGFLGTAACLGFHLKINAYLVHALCGQIQNRYTGLSRNVIYQITDLLP